MADIGLLNEEDEEDEDFDEDGMELEDMEGELYSEERLCRLLNAIKDADAELICKKVKEDVDRFVGDALQFDDITMLALCYQGSQE